MRSGELNQKAIMDYAQHPYKDSTKPLNLEAGKRKKSPAPAEGHALLALRRLAVCRKKI